MGTRNRTKRRVKTTDEAAAKLHELLLEVAPRRGAEEIRVAIDALLEAAEDYRVTFVRREDKHLVPTSISETRAELKTLHAALHQAMGCIEGMSPDAIAIFRNHYDPIVGLLERLRSSALAAAASVHEANRAPNRTPDNALNVLAYGVARILRDALHVRVSKTLPTPESTGVKAAYARVLIATASLAGMQQIDTKRLMREGLKLLDNPHGEKHVP